MLPGRFFFTAETFALLTQPAMSKKSMAHQTASASVLFRA
jgi:hypothetical protein